MLFRYLISKVWILRRFLNPPLLLYHELLLQLKSFDKLKKIFFCTHFKGKSVIIVNDRQLKNLTVDKKLISKRLY